MQQWILVVDDNAAVRDIVRHTLESAGYQVVAAKDGEEALAIYRHHRVDAAVIDVNMPGLSGVEVCRGLHEQAAAAGTFVAVWLMTGVVGPELIAAAEAAGALGVFAKPFTRSELLDSLADHLVRPKHAIAS